MEQACERMILEAVRLLQEGQLEQAEYLLEEGALASFALPDNLAMHCLSQHSEAEHCSYSTSWPCVGSFG